MAILPIQNTKTHNTRKKNPYLFLKSQAKKGGTLTYSNNIMFALVKDNNILEF